MKRAGCNQLEGWRADERIDFAHRLNFRFRKIYLLLTQYLKKVFQPDSLKAVVCSDSLSAGFSLSASLVSDDTFSLKDKIPSDTQ